MPDRDPSQMTLHETIKAGIVDWDARVKDIEAAIARMPEGDERDDAHGKWKKGRILMHSRDFIIISYLHSALCDATMRRPGEKVGW